MLLKMLFVSYQYNVLERDVESLTNLHLGVKWFVGLGANERPPYHRTLTKLEKQIVENREGWKRLLRDLRLARKDANKERWQALVADPAHERTKSQPYRVEQPFGPAKQKQGFSTPAARQYTRKSVEGGRVITLSLGILSLVLQLCARGGSVGGVLVLDQASQSRAERPDR